MVYITGDIHGDYNRFLELERFCHKHNLGMNDWIVCLGDVGLNYYGKDDPREWSIKTIAADIPANLFCIHGNHERRPSRKDGYKLRKICGDICGRVWYDPQYPNQYFAIDGEVYQILSGIEMLNCLVCGGTHQLQWDYENKYYIDTPKSERGNRTIPLSPIAVKCFENVIANRKQLKNEPMVDGYVGFLFLTNRGSPQMVKHVDQHLDTIINGYNACHKGKELHITPHTFRHTFCSRMIQSGMDIKSVQYLMGHATAQITLDVYSHVMQESNIDDFFKKTS